MTFPSIHRSSCWVKMRRCRYARSWPQSQSSRKQCMISRVDNIIPDVVQPSSSSTSCSQLALFVTCLLYFNVVVDWNELSSSKYKWMSQAQNNHKRNLVCIDDCKITSFIWVPSSGTYTCRHSGLLFAVAWLNWGPVHDVSLSCELLLQCLVILIVHSPDYVVLS